MSEVEIKDKILLTIEEACKLSNIGENALYNLIDKTNGDFIIHVGAKGGKRLIKRKKFEEWLYSLSSIQEQR